MKDTFKKRLLLKVRNLLGLKKQSKLMEQLQKEIDNAEGSGLCHEARTKIALLVIPEVFKDYDDTRQQADPKVAREWAEALAQIIGLLVGTCVKSGKTDSAISMLMLLAKNQARVISRAAEQLSLAREKNPKLSEQDIGRVISDLKPPPPEAPPAQDLGKPTIKDHRLRLIEDLEAQAMLATVPEVQQALNEQAQRMRRELELDNAA